MPSGLQTGRPMPASDVVRANTSSPAASSHTTTCRQACAVATRVPSGLMADGPRRGDRVTSNLMRGFYGAVTAAALEGHKAVSACEVDFLDGQIPNIPESLHDQFEIFKSREILLEWSPKGVHKAEGLVKLIGHLGIKQAEVMACGDEDNDLSMIDWAGLGVCMANGSDQVKQVADIITPMTNEEDAVAWAIRKYVLGEE